LKRSRLMLCSLVAVSAFLFIGIEKVGLLYKPTAATSAMRPVGNSPADTTAHVAPAHSPEQSLLMLLLNSAESGRILDDPFLLEKTMFEDVTAKWGEPEQTFSANGISYASYVKGHQTIIGYNKGMQVVDIQRFDPRFLAIQETEVIHLLGQPAAIQDMNGLITYTYPLADKYPLLVNMEETTADKPLRLVKSVRLLYPVGMRNLMAIGSNLELAEGMRYLATEGKVLGSEYPVGQTMFDVVEKEWGTPSATKMYQRIMYASYPEQGIVFGYNKGMQIVEIRSFDLRLRELTRSEIKKVFGEPKETHSVGDQIIDVYLLTNKFESKIVYSRPTAKAPDPHVDHMNVLAPKGFVNVTQQE